MNANRRRSYSLKDDSMGRWKVLGEYRRSKEDVSAVVDISNTYDIPNNASEIFMKFHRPVAYGYDEIIIGDDNIMKWIVNETTDLYFNGSSSSSLGDKFTIYCLGVKCETYLSVHTTVYSYHAILSDEYVHYKFIQRAYNNSDLIYMIDRILEIPDSSNSLLEIQGKLLSNGVENEGYTIFYR